MTEPVSSDEVLVVVMRGVVGPASVRAAVIAAAALAALAGCRETGEAEDRRPARDARHPDGEAGRAAREPAPPPIAPPAPIALPDVPPLAEPPRGLPSIASPAHNPTTAEKVELGRLLFFDPRMSASGKTSCASCHQPERGWSDGVPRARTDAGRPNLRHTPTLYGVGYHREWAWDGAMPTLEALILSHWRGQLGDSLDGAIGLCRRAPAYAARFGRAFPGEPSREHVAEALAAFARTLVSSDSPWDRHEAGARAAVTADAVAGFDVFVRRAACATCHVPPLYTDLDYHDRGIRGDPAIDPGRMRISADVRDQSAFKTPTLRGLVHTAPYFHDGSSPALETAVAAELARSQIALTSTERHQLLAFLRSLSGPPPSRDAPSLPASP